MFVESLEGVRVNHAEILIITRFWSIIVAWFDKGRQPLQNKEDRGGVT
jgi:hypothetical protein